jgi:mycothiol synthase
MSVQNFGRLTRATKIEEMDEMSATEEQLAAMNELVVEIDKETLPDDPPRPAAEYIAWIRGSAPYEHKRMWLIRDGGRAVAMAEVNWEEKDENRERLYVWLAVTASERRKGLAKELLKPAVETAKQLGRNRLFSWLSGGGSPHEEFAKHMGAQFSMNEYHNRLFIEELDRSMLDDWIARAPERASDYSLEFWQGATKPDDLEQFAKVMDSMNSAPRPEDWEDEKYTPEQVRGFEERWIAAGFELWRYVARHNSTGEIAGYTAMFPNQWRPEFADQGDTGVLDKHRNKGLGRWLTAAMLVKLLDERPKTRWVETGNATTNKPMLAINNALGFRPVETWATYLHKADDLGARL